MEDEEVRVPLRQSPQVEARKKKKARKTQRKYAALVIVGVLTCLYSIGEVGFALYVNSMALLSDGGHNASDVISLIIAFWALYKSTNENKSVSMTYGWRRAEILGAVMNGCFLISLCVYIVLEAIPKIIKDPTRLDSSWYFIGISASGFVINTLGTILFSVISGGHGHVHAGGGDHGHGHGKKKKDKHDEEIGHGHSHGEKKKHDHEEGNGHGHSHGQKKEKHDHEEGNGQKKKEKHDHEEGHGHGHGQKKKEKHDHEEGHGHSHGQKKKEKHDHDEEKGHGHGHGQKKKEKHDHDEETGHGHGHEKKKEKHDHDEEMGHGHGHGKKKEKDSEISGESQNNKKGFKGDQDPVQPINSQNDGFQRWIEEDRHDSHDDCDEEVHEMKEPEDHNMRAVFLHYLGDALSSLLVLGAGLLSKYFPHDQWTLYLDPGCSLLIVLLILWTTIPLIYQCSKILLQKAPSHLHIPSLKDKLLQIPGVRGLHDLHVWELIDSLYIASAHVIVQDNSEAKNVLERMKTVMHKNGIHSSTLQVEYIEHSQDKSCRQFCVEECPEDWCCKDIDMQTYE